MREKRSGLELRPPSFGESNAIRHAMPLSFDEAFRLEAVEDTRHLGSREKARADEILLKDRTASLDDLRIQPALVSREQPEGNFRRG